MLLCKINHQWFTGNDAVSHPTNRNICHGIQQFLHRGHGFGGFWSEVGVPGRSGLFAAGAFDVLARPYRVAHFASVSSIGDEAALSLMTETVDQYRSMIEAADASDSFELRVKTGSGPDVLGVVASADHCSNLAELIAAAEPRRGVVLVVVGAVESAKSQVRVDEDGNARLEPLGLDLTAAAMPVETAASIADLLEELSDEHDPAGFTEMEAEESSRGRVFDPGTVSSAASSLEPLTLVDDSGFGLGEYLNEVADDWEPPSSPVIVRLLGEPHVDGFEDLSRLARHRRDVRVCEAPSPSGQVLLVLPCRQSIVILRRRSSGDVFVKLRRRSGAPARARLRDSAPLLCVLWQAASTCVKQRIMPGIGRSRALRVA